MKTRSYLTNMKSRCLMLMACLTLILGITACSSEDFGTDLPEQEKTYTKQELIEQALSRVPWTKAVGDAPMLMVTINKTVSIKCKASQSVRIVWGDTTYIVPPNSNSVYIHTYTNNFPSNLAYIIGSTEAIQSLSIENNGIIALTLNCKNLSELYCQDNLLDELNLANCLSLAKLNASNNELTSIETSALSKLSMLLISNNYLTKVDFSNNEFLEDVSVDNNQIKNIDLTNNSRLAILFIGENPITDLNLKNNHDLIVINISHLSLRTFNELPIDLIEPDVFSIYKELMYIDVAYTPFTVLDVSQNPFIYAIDISGTNITELDLSNLKIEILCASRSKLAKLNYAANTFNNLYDLRVERTPLENDQMRISNLVAKLPDRNGYIQKGTLYTYTSHINNLVPTILAKNWLINP